MNEAPTTQPPSPGRRGSLSRRSMLVLVAGGALAAAAGLVPRWLRHTVDEANTAGSGAGDRQDTDDSAGEPRARNESVPDGANRRADEPPEGGAGAEDGGEAEQDGDAGVHDPDAPSVPVAPALVVICREKLGLAPARADSRTHQISALTLHHTAVRLADLRDAPGRLRGHQQFHMDQGWPDIAYHFGVDLAGNVYELRDPSMPGDTFTDYAPEGHFLVVCEGNFSAQAPTDALLDSVAGLFAYASDHYGVAVSTIAGHRDYAATSCPGDALYARLDDVIRQVHVVSATKPPALQPWCDDAAAQHVRMIERGG